MEPNPILITLFSFLPSLVAAIRKTKNRKTLFIINGITGLINIYMGFNLVESTLTLGGLGEMFVVAVILFLSWFGCLIAAIAGKKDATQSGKAKSDKKINKNQSQVCPDKIKEISAVVCSGIATLILIVLFGNTFFLEIVLLICAFIASLLIIRLMNKYKISETFAFIATGILIIIVSLLLLGTYMPWLVIFIMYLAVFAMMFTSGYILLIKRKFKNNDILITAFMAMVIFITSLALESTIPFVLYLLLSGASCVVLAIAIYKILKFVAYSHFADKAVTSLKKTLHKPKHKYIIMIAFGVLLVTLYIGLYIYANGVSYEVCRYDDHYKDVVCKCVQSELSTWQKLSYANTSNLKAFMADNPNAGERVMQCVTSQLAIDTMF